MIKPKPTPSSISVSAAAKVPPNSPEPAELILARELGFLIGTHVAQRLITLKSAGIAALPVANDQ